MQLLQDSLQQHTDSINPDTFIGHVAGVNSIHADTAPVKTKENLVNVFQGHELKPKHAAPQALAHERGDWIFFLLLFVVAVFAYLRMVYGKYLTRLVNALFNINITNQTVRDENVLVQRASLLLNFIFYVVAALLMYFISLQFDWQMPHLKNGFARFLFFGIVITGLYFLKLILLRIAGWIFSLDREMAAYIFNIFLINNLVGVALIPILTLFIFFGNMHLQWLLVAAVVLVASGYVYRLIRGIFIGIGSSPASVAYLFLYICALEIAPLFVLIKLISQQ
jgi:hypothetical protein